MKRTTVDNLYKLDHIIDNILLLHGEKALEIMNSSYIRLEDTEQVEYGNPNIANEELNKRIALVEEILENINETNSC